jgi:FAD/FMN-containing dehydrogenase
VPPAPHTFAPLDLPPHDPAAPYDLTLVAAALGERLPRTALLTRGAEFAQYGKDASRDFARPELVVLAADIPQVQHTLHVAHHFRVPVYARGLGSGLSGCAVPTRGGIVLDVSPLNRLLDIDRINRSARVQAGLTAGALNAALAEHGLWYPPWPSSRDISSLGGNFATNAGGLTTTKYGPTRQWVLGCTAVLPGGELIHTGCSAVKDVAGFDLTQLLCGSEGLLAVVVELELKLTPLPPCTATCRAVFPTDEAALAAAMAVLAGPVTPRIFEYIAAPTIACVVDYLGDEARDVLGVSSDGAQVFRPASSPLGHGPADPHTVFGAKDKAAALKSRAPQAQAATPQGRAPQAQAATPQGRAPQVHSAGALLCAEVDAVTEHDALVQLAQLREALDAHGPLDVAWTSDSAEAQRLWRVRQEVSPACFQRGTYKLADDVTVPRSALLEFDRGLKAAAQRNGVEWLNYGHVGDADFHPTLMFAGPDDPRVAGGEAALREVCELAVSLRGSITGEHGVGSLKAPYLPLQVGPTELALMRGIKAAFDPRGILNPGKWV